MAVYKLNLDEFESDLFHIIAIHTAIEDSRLAFLINQKLNILLKKSKTNIQIATKSGEAQFENFCFFDEKKGIKWNLVKNQTTLIKNNKATVANLFSETTAIFDSNVFLLSEYKKADYVLKMIPNDSQISILDIQTKLNSIRNLTTAYSIDSNTIRSKNNLIF
jgi:hypothetical protein